MFYFSNKKISLVWFFFCRKFIEIYFFPFFCTVVDCKVGQTCKNDKHHQAVFQTVHSKYNMKLIIKHDALNRYPIWISFRYRYQCRLSDRCVSAQSCWSVGAFCFGGKQRAAGGRPLAARRVWIGWSARTRRWTCQERLKCSGSGTQKAFGPRRSSAHLQEGGRKRRAGRLAGRSWQQLGSVFDAVAQGQGRPGPPGQVGNSGRIVFGHAECVPAAAVDSWPHISTTKGSRTANKRWPLTPAEQLRRTPDPAWVARFQLLIPTKTCFLSVPRRKTCWLVF